MARKVIVEVEACFDTNGRITPLSIRWEDGRWFSVDRVLEMRKAASLRTGGHGIRYTCRIRNKEVYLFFDDPQWFMEVAGS